MINPNQLPSDAEPLLRIAIGLVRTGDYAAAAWRIADALSIIADVCPPSTMGVDRPTSRGARLQFPRRIAIRFCPDPNVGVGPSDAA